MIIEFKEGQSLLTKDLVKRLGISASSFKNNKKDILYELAGAWQYQVEYKGRSTIYHFKKKNYDFQYNGKRSKKDKLRDETYRDFIIEVIGEQPLNTAKNLDRISKEFEQVMALGYSEKTNYEYIRVRVRKFFGCSEHDRGTFEDMDDLMQRLGYIKRRVWCRLVMGNNEHFDYYQPITEEQVKEYFKMIKDKFKQKDTIENKASIYSDYQTGLITEDEMKQMLSSIDSYVFRSVQTEYKDKYGFRPIKVPEYQLYPEVVEKIINGQFDIKQVVADKYKSKVKIEGVQKWEI